MNKIIMAQLGKQLTKKADDLNLAVEQYKLIPQSKNPKFRHDGDKYAWVHIGYYGTIHCALKKIVNAELAESNVKDVADLIEKINELYSEIKNVDVPEGLEVR